MFATPTIHEDITTDNMKLKEFWWKRAATKLKVDQMEIRSIDNRNRTKAKEKLRSRPNQIHRVQKFISVLHFDPTIIQHIFKYTHDSKKYDFPLHCNPKDLSDLGLYKKGEKLCHDDADIYSNLGKICILPNYPLSSVQFDIDQCEEEAASKALASKTIPKRVSERIKSRQSLELYRKRRKIIGTIDTLTKQMMTLKSKADALANTVNYLHAHKTPTNTPTSILMPQSLDTTMDMCVYEVDGAGLNLVSTASDVFHSHPRNKSLAK